MANDNTRLGKMSLKSAIVALVLPAALVILLRTFPQLLSDKPLAKSLCALLICVPAVVGVGCGIAGFTDEQIAKLFFWAVNGRLNINVDFPEQWKQYLDIIPSYEIKY